MTEPLWRISEIVEATGGNCSADQSIAVTGISIDTRTLEKGDLYIAIVGDVHDGHKFVKNAFDAGASCALVSKDYKPEGDYGPLIIVDDTMTAMEALGQASRARSKAKIIAVTGSVGKTGTKESLRQCLEGLGKVHASVKSFNNHWGVPISLARMPRDTEYGVFEVGMNHPGEITPLTKFIRPHITIITTVAPVHIEFFKNIEEIAAAKAEIFDGLEAEGYAILNMDNPHYDFLKERAVQKGAQIISFGEHQEAEARLLDLELHTECSDAKADILGEMVEFTLGITGKHLVLNTLAVLAAIKLAGADTRQAANALAKIKAQDGRGAKQIISRPDGDIAIVDESYNANPASMKAAIGAFAQSTAASNRHILVLGDMLELGKESSKLHKDLLNPILDAGIDKVYLCGPYMKDLYQTIPSEKQGAYGENSEQLTPLLLKDIGPGDAVMVKGSLGSKMGPVVEVLKNTLG